jgi:phage replication-related protein YjqB (UPF0714/DUF867 family)
VIAELLAHDGVVETCELRATVGFMAIHGGSLERGTAEVARRSADACGASIYTIEQPDDLQWHIPSNLGAFLDHVDVVVSVHGYGREGWWTRLLVGGTNRDLATRTAGTLRRHLDGFEVLDLIDAIPRELRGLHPGNPVNRPRGGGVQLELPPRVRGLGPNGRREYVDALVGGLTELFS